MKVTLLEPEAVRLALDALDGARLALDFGSALDDHDLVVGRNVPVRDPVLDVHEARRRTEVGRDRHRELAALDGWRAQVRERPLEGLAEVARGHGDGRRWG